MRSRGRSGRCSRRGEEEEQQWCDKCKEQTMAEMHYNDGEAEGFFCTVCDFPTRVLS
jgi:hypothetical protein